MNSTLYSRYGLLSVKNDVNTMQKACLLSVAFLCATLSNITAQPLTILVDASSGNISYYHGNTQIANPKVKKGEAIVLKVQNYNNYLYTAEIIERNEDLKPGEAISPLNKAPGFGFGELLKSFSYTPPSNASVGLTQVSFHETETLDNQHVAVTEPETSPNSMSMQLKKTGWKQLKELIAIENEMHQIEQKKDQLLQRKKIRTFSVAEVGKLKHNPHLPATRIKQHATAMLGQALNLQPDQLADLNEVFKQNDDLGQMNALKLEHQSQLKEYHFGVSQLQSIDTQLKALSENDVEAALFHNAFSVQLTNSSQVENKAVQLSEEIDSLSAELSETNLEDILQIWYQYEAITSNDFSTTYRTVAKHDITAFDITFVRKASVTDAEVPEKVQLAPVQLQSHGGVKINTSLGMNLGAYAQDQFSYFVEEGVIKAQTEDRITPFVASYLHFYSQGKGSISFGGSLGLGLPLGSELGLSSAHLFVGPSLFFGNAERFVVNFGIMGGKSKQLARGLKINDLFAETTDDLPLHDKYSLGYVVGLSFNLR
jgi:hypothetical protein